MKIEELGKHSIIIDFSDLFTKSVTNIHYKQGEIGTSSIKAKLVKKRVPIDLTNCRVVVNIITEKGEPIVDRATILEEKEGIVEFKFEQIALNTGTSFFELTIVDENYNTKKSPKIAYRVLDSFSEDAVIESEKFPILVNMIKEVDDLHTHADNLVEETTQLQRQTVKLNEGISQAESVRETQEGIRQENEIARIENMENMRNEMTTALDLLTDTIDELDNKFDRLESGQEVVQARDGEESLSARLERDLVKVKEVYVAVEGSNISTDSSGGYLKDIEILGNTVQNSDNLADIRSVGDKVEGQELYEIPLQVTNGLQNTEANYQEYTLNILSPTPLEKIGDVEDRIVCREDGIWGVEKSILTEKVTQIDGKEVLSLNDTTDGVVLHRSKENVLYGNNVTNILLEGFLTVKVQGGNFAPYTVYTNTSNNVACFPKGTSLKTMEETLIDKTVRYVMVKPQFIPLPHDQQVQLRTFVNKTNILFNCEIAGTIKAQVPKNIGATVNTHTEQISSLNKELDKVKKLEESTVSTIETENNFTIIEATSNGYVEDVKLEGKTFFVGSTGEISDTMIEGSTLKSIGDMTDKISVSTINKNLYRGSAEVGTISISTGENLSSSTRIRTEFIPVGDVENLLQSMYSDSLVQINTFFYDANKQYLGRTGTKSGEHIILELPKGTKYIRAIYKRPNDGDITPEDVNVFIDSLMITKDLDCRVYKVHKEDVKPVLYYNTETQTWEKPMLRQWDSIEKHSDGKYYYHQRSIESSYVSGDEAKADCITDLRKTVKKLSEEKVYECTNIGLITYTDETNYIVESGAIAPKSILKVHNNISNVVKILQQKVSILENKFIEGLKQVLAGDMQGLAYTLYPEDFASVSEIVEEQ